MAIRYSVIIPTLNEEKFLPKLLESLAVQTQKDFEVIVVDGASRDKTVAVAKSYTQKLPRLTVLTLPNPNVSEQRNTGAKAAKGQWLIFVDADSVLLPYALERVGAFIKEKNPGLFTSWFRSDTENPSDAVITLLFIMFIEAAILVHRPSTQGTFIVVSTKAFRAVGGFNKTYLFGEDHDLVTRLIKKGYLFTILRESLYVYSFRRLRYQKKLKTFQTYARAVFSVLLTKKTPQSMPGYIMGGAQYAGKKDNSSAIKQFNKKFRAFIKEVFE